MDAAALEKLVGGPRDGALLRLSLGRIYLGDGRARKAASHLREAVRQDPAYTAAWKELGRALSEAGEVEEARAAWRRGIETAEAAGDVQAEKEMTVFLKRLERRAEGDRT